jgi:hypothetical protein
MSGAPSIFVSQTKYKKKEDKSLIPISNPSTDDDALHN